MDNILFVVFGGVIICIGCVPGGMVVCLTIIGFPLATERHG